MIPQAVLEFIDLITQALKAFIAIAPSIREKNISDLEDRRLELLDAGDPASILRAGELKTTIERLRAQSVGAV